MQTKYTCNVTISHNLGCGPRPPPPPWPKSCAYVAWLLHIACMFAFILHLICICFASLLVLLRQLWIRSMWMVGETPGKHLHVIDLSWFYFCCFHLTNYVCRRMILATILANMCMCVLYSCFYVVLFSFPNFIHFTFLLLPENDPRRSENPCQNEHVIDLLMICVVCFS